MAVLPRISLTKTFRRLFSTAFEVNLARVHTRFSADEQFGKHLMHFSSHPQTGAAHLTCTAAKAQHLGSEVTGRSCPAQSDPTPKPDANQLGSEKAVSGQVGWGQKNYGGHKQ